MTASELMRGRSPYFLNRRLMYGLAAKGPNPRFFSGVFVQGLNGFGDVFFGCARVDGAEAQHSLAAQLGG